MIKKDIIYKVKYHQKLVNCPISFTRPALQSIKNMQNRYYQ